MDMQTYQQLALRTAPDAGGLVLNATQLRLLLGALGAADEAGEIAGIVKKHVFHGHPFDGESRTKLRKEIGDVLWYLNYLAFVLDRDLGEIADLNIEKLSARYPEGHFSTDRSMNRAAGDE